MDGRQSFYLLRLQKFLSQLVDVLNVNYISETMY